MSVFLTVHLMNTDDHLYIDGWREHGSRLIVYEYGWSKFGSFPMLDVTKGALSANTYATSFAGIYQCSLDRGGAGSQWLCWLSVVVLVVSSCVW